MRTKITANHNPTVPLEEIFPGNVFVFADTQRYEDPDDYMLYMKCAPDPRCTRFECPIVDLDDGSIEYRALNTPVYPVNAVLSADLKL